MKAEIRTDKGIMTVEFFEKDAPKTVENFVKLSESGFYNGLNFHRVIPNFVIQGGGFTANGKKNIGYVFDDEFTKNSNGELKYKHDYRLKTNRHNTVYS